MTGVFFHIVRNEWKSLLRGKWIAGYGLIFLLLTDILFRFGGGGSEALLSLTNIMLLFIPLTGMLYGVLYLYQSREFIELLLTQPIGRGTLYRGLFTGISTPLTAAFLVGISLPMVWHGLLRTDPSSVLLVMGLGSLLTLIFVALGFAISLWYFDDRIRGFGVTIVLWLIMAILYDGFVLLLIFLLGDFPLERFVIAASVLNPVDLARISIMLKFDVSALMGYTGAVFHRFFGTATGILAAGSMLGVWLLAPAWAGLRVFQKKDF